MKLFLAPSLIFCSIVFLFSCSKPISQDAYHVVFKNDKDGKALFGSKEELIKHIRSGSSIRVGWGSKGKTRGIEHLAEPIWISVLNEQEVSVQLHAHYSGSVDWENLSSSFEDSSLVNIEWRVILSTKGEFDAVWYDKYKGELVRRVPQRHPMTWFVKGKIEKGTPLYLNE